MQIYKKKKQNSDKSTVWIFRQYSISLTFEMENITLKKCPCF